jgi:HEAT repeat protein
MLGVGLVLAFGSGCATDGSPPPAADSLEEGAESDQHLDSGETETAATDAGSTEAGGAPSQVEKPRKGFQGEKPWLKRREEQRRLRQAKKERLKIKQIDPAPEVAEAFATSVEVLQHAEDPDQRWQAAIAIAKLDRNASVYYLIEALKDPDAKVVVHVMYQLRLTGHPGAIMPIVNMRNHPDPRVREAVQRIVRSSGPTS